MQPYTDRLYVHAKLFARRAQMLLRDDYIHLLNAGSLESAFPDLAPKSPAGEHIHIKEQLFRDETAPVRNLIDISIPYRPLLKAFLRLFEAENAKQLLAQSYGRTQFVTLWFDISPHHRLERDLLKASLSRGELLGILHNTCIYQQVLSESDYGRYECIETGIDINTARGFLISIKEACGFRDTAVHAVAALKLCLLRRMFHMRLTRYCGMDSTQAEQHLAGITGLMREAADEQRGIHCIDVRIDRAHGLSSCDTAGRELAYELYFWSHVWKYFSRDFHSPACVVCYLLLLLYQIRNLFCVVEGFRFRLPPEEIQKRLIVGH